MTDDQKEAYEERAEIMEYDGGLSREEAERLAYEQVIGNAALRGDSGLIAGVPLESTVMQHNYERD